MPSGKEPTVGRIDKREKRVDPANWASLKPFGIGQQKPNNYRELWRAFKENRDNAAYAWRILTQGTCDGCSLGTMGMRDWTMEEIHLCNIRLRLLRLNTMPALDIGLLADVGQLQRKRSAELRDLGRLPHPMVRRKGKPGFTRVGWDEALDLIADRIRASSPDRLGVYLTSRGTPNENYYAAQKAVRAIGTNSIDNAARVCHSPSTFGLKGSVGVAATTCSYTDWIGSDLVVFIGSNIANSQPVAMKYLYHAKKAGTKVVTVNSYREPGMGRYWVPSNVESAVFGTKITDRFFLINVGGDIAFLNGTLKVMVGNGWVDQGFIADHTAGFDEVRGALDAQSFEELEAQAGAPRSEMEAFARMLGQARTAVLVWSMGITQHEFGEDNVRAIINLGLTKGFVGRDKCGLMPIRGHSGVQGGAEMGAYSTALPGGLPLDEENAARFSELWGFEVPGGVTETSTERRVIFSPEIPGPRIGEARPEWEIFVDLAKRVRPDLADLVHFGGTADIRADIARCVPAYDGIQRLAAFGDQFQYGGPHLAAGWKFPTPDGKAHWSVVRPPTIDLPDGSFMVATRRGKQFNSMVHERTDGLTGAAREAVLISLADAQRLGLADGDPVLLRSASGEFRGRARLAQVTPGNLQVHWPEAEGLIDRGRRSPQAGIPDYNAVVTVEKIDAAAAAGV